VSSAVQYSAVQYNTVQHSEVGIVMDRGERTS
jgi:hypothetical protein